MADQALIDQIKKIQRSDPSGKAAWIKHCEDAGQNIRDPSKQDPAFIVSFLTNFTPGQNPAPATDVFAEYFKDAQRNSLNFKRCWAQFRESFADGKTDPARVPKDHLYGFLEFLGQQGLMAIGSKGGKGGQAVANYAAMTMGKSNEGGSFMSNGGGASRGDDWYGGGDSMHGGGDSMYGGGDSMYGDGGSTGMKGISKGKGKGKNMGMGMGMSMGNGDASWDNSMSYGDGGMMSSYSQGKSKGGKGGGDSNWSHGQSMKRGYNESFGSGFDSFISVPSFQAQPSYGGMNFGGKGSSKIAKPAVTVGSPQKAQYVDKIKAYQRLGESQKRCWWEFCDSAHGGVRDPFRLDEVVLAQFVNTFQL